MKRLSALLLLVAVLFSASAYAALNLELTRGIDAALPIAIIPFGNATVTQVVTHDLQNSGQFRVKGPGLMGPQSSSADPVDNTFWRKRGVDNVLTGRVKNLGGDRYRVSRRNLCRRVPRLSTAFL